METYTIKEVAVVLRKSEKQVRRYIKDGKLSANKDDGMYRISKAVLSDTFGDLIEQLSTHDETSNGHNKDLGSHPSTQEDEKNNPDVQPSTQESEIEVPVTVAIDQEDAEVSAMSTHDETSNGHNKDLGSHPSTQSGEVSTQKTKPVDNNGKAEKGEDPAFEIIKTTIEALNSQLEKKDVQLDKKDEQLAQQNGHITELIKSKEHSDLIIANLGTRLGIIEPGKSAEEVIKKVEEEEIVDAEIKDQSAVKTKAENKDVDTPTKPNGKASTDGELTEVSGGESNGEIDSQVAESSPAETEVGDEDRDFEEEEQPGWWSRVKARISA